MRNKWIIVLIAAVFLIIPFLAMNDIIPRKPLLPQKRAANDIDLAGGPEREVRGFPKRKILDLSSLFPDIFILKGKGDTKKLALTFDDGPDGIYSPQILNTLKENNVKATFFVIGKRCEAFPNVFNRMINEGHLIANHTWNHPNLVKLPNNKIIEEIEKTNALLKKYGIENNYFRSPYGSLDPEKVRLIGNNGYKIIAWNIDSLDWKGLSAEEVKTNVLENVVNGSIILQHSAGGVGEDLSGTVKALPQIIDVLKKEGYQFVKISDLLKK